jgi:hypothetical protein
MRAISALSASSFISVDWSAKYRVHWRRQSGILSEVMTFQRATSQMREQSEFFPLYDPRIARPSFVHWKILRNVFIEIQND